MRKVDQVKCIEQETFSLGELGYKKNNTNEKQKNSSTLRVGPNGYTVALLVVKNF